VVGGAGNCGSGGIVILANRSPTMSFRFATIRHENRPALAASFA
jgi:hypothetical protein